MRVAHHLLLSHGRTVQLYRALGGSKPIGIALNLTPAVPASDSLADRLAAKLHDGHNQPLVSRAAVLSALP
jgi:beta-glucosidase